MRRTYLLLAVAVSTTVTSPLAATSFVRVSDEALVDQAPVALVVRVAERLSHRPFVTEYVAEVEEVLKGRTAGETVRIVVPGGVGPGGLGLRIDGAPRFAAGDRALVFLEPAEAGTWRFVHFFLGAFHAVPAGDRTLAVRGLAEARELVVGQDGAPRAVDSGPAEPGRDFAAFAAWVKDRARGVVRAADYAVIEAKYTLFRDPADGHNMRWFEFDDGGSVTFRAYEIGQSGLDGGGFAEFQTALAAWTADPATRIDYRYGGTTDETGGITVADGVSSIVWNDPTHVLRPFSCSSGGILAVGGPFYFTATTPYLGTPFHRIAEADIVVNSGLECFFAASPEPRRAAEELAAHELGHTLGLAHACGDAVTPSCTGRPRLDRALMRAFVHDDGRGAALGVDDRRAILFLYAGAAVPEAPSNLTASPLSTSEIRLTWSDNASGETEYRVERRAVGGSFAELATLAADTTTFVATGLAPGSVHLFRVRAVGAGGASSDSNLAAAATDAVPAPCVADAASLCLQDGRFRVRAAWATAAATGVGTAIPSTPADDSGLLWFFAPDNWEIAVKVLDGCAVNGRFWVFAAALSDVELALTVTDTTTGATRVYFNPLGTLAETVADTSAFATCP